MALLSLSASLSTGTGQWKGSEGSFCFTFPWPSCTCCARKEEMPPIVWLSIWSPADRSGYGGEAFSFPREDLAVSPEGAGSLPVEGF